MKEWASCLNGKSGTFAVHSAGEFYFQSGDLQPKHNLYCWRFGYLCQTIVKFPKYDTVLIASCVALIPCLSTIMCNMDTCLLRGYLLPADLASLGFVKLVFLLYCHSHA
ncbi:hypothetical protein V8C42DRAFT_309113 [Trichoderma barbatum]